MLKQIFSTSVSDLVGFGERMRDQHFRSEERDIEGRPLDRGSGHGGYGARSL